MNKEAAVILYLFIMHFYILLLCITCTQKPPFLQLRDFKYENVILFLKSPLAIFVQPFVGTN